MTEPASVPASAAAVVVGLGRSLVAAGLVAGSAGNVSAIDGGRVLMSPTDSGLAALDAGVLSVLTRDGEHIAGPRPTKEAALHLAMYARDAGARVVVHVHSPCATAVACLPPFSAHTAVAPLTPYLLMKVGQVPLIPYRAPGDPQQAALVRAHPLPFRAALLANHGAIVAAPDAPSALTAAIELEEACRVMLALRGAPAVLLDPAQIAELVARGGTPWTPDA